MPQDYCQPEKRLLRNQAALRRLLPYNVWNIHSPEEIEQFELADLVEVNQRSGIGDGR